MGTKFTIKVGSGNSTYSTQSRELNKEIQQELARLENIFSTYKSDSEISKINLGLNPQANTQSHYKKNSSPDTSIESKKEPSKDWQLLLDMASEIEKSSQGTFSFKLGRLVEYWGFGPSPPLSIQDLDRRRRDIDSIRSMVDCSRKKPSDCRKKEFSYFYDFSGIAKGYAVDSLARILEQKGIQEYMVEIGGEVCVSIKDDSKKDAWKIGIISPIDPGIILKAVRMTKGCIATSGNSQQYIWLDGKMLTHILDPRTGYPIEKSFSSVTVYMDHDSGWNGAKSDAWATAFYVLGKEKGLSLANEKDIAVMFLDKHPNRDTVVTTTSLEWERLFGNQFMREKEK